MKDVTGRTFGPSDYITYANRHGSHMGFKFGKVLALGTRDDWRGKRQTLLVRGAERRYDGRYSLQSKRSTLSRGDTAVILRRDQLDLALVSLLDSAEVLP